MERHMQLDIDSLGTVPICNVQLKSNENMTVTRAGVPQIRQETDKIGETITHA